MASLSLVIVIAAVAMSHWPVPDARSLIIAPVVSVKHYKKGVKMSNSDTSPLILSIYLVI